MKAIVGLGNPGLRYAQTRHNAGFLVLDSLAARWHGVFQKTIWKGETARVSPAGRDVVLAKPGTFMNFSGRFVAPLVNYYRLELKDVLVVHDDLDLPLGRIRAARAGGSGGHKGIESLLVELGSTEFPRVRIGIGHPGREGQGGDVVEYVLSSFGPGEADLFRKAIELAADAAECWVEKGIDFTMNRFNGISA